MPVALLSSGDGGTALHGFPSDRHWLHDEWVVVDPERGLRTLTVNGIVYVLARCRGADLYRLPLYHVRFLDYDAAALTWIDGHPAVLAAHEDTVTFEHLLTDEPLRAPWRAPAGWMVDELVSVRDHPYAWLRGDPDHWRGWLWDPVADRPVRPPLRVVGYRWPVTQLSTRPAMLTKVNWEAYQVWDLALGAAVGPALSADTPDLTAPSLGTLHGRAVLAASTGTEVRVWDLLTASVLHAAGSPVEPLATALGPDDQLYVLDADGALHAFAVPLRNVHPLTKKTRPSRGPGGQ